MTDKLFRPLVDTFLLVWVYTKNPTAWNYGMLCSKNNLPVPYPEYHSKIYLNPCIVETVAIFRVGDVALDLLQIEDNGVHKVTSEYIASVFNTSQIIQQDNPFPNQFVNCRQIVKIIASTDKSLNLNNIPEDFINAWIEDPTIKIEDVFFIDGELQIVLNENYIPHQ